MEMVLVLAILVPIVIVVTALFINSRLEKKKRQTGHFFIELPAGWHQEPGENAFTFKPDGEDTGILQISLQPPFEPNITTTEEAEEKLIELVSQFSGRLGADMGEQVLFTSELGASGFITTARYKGGDTELTQFWMIPTDVTIFATYMVGKPEKAEEEFAAASNIMKTVGFK